MNDFIHFCRMLIKANIEAREQISFGFSSFYGIDFIYSFIFLNIFLCCTAGLPGSSYFERSKRLNILKMGTCLNIRKNGLIFLGNKMRKSVWQMAGGFWDFGISHKGHSEENKTHIQGE